jgi:DNA-binding PadR family transcriptional regulator
MPMKDGRQGVSRRITAKALSREILLSFWKCHILHHASERAVYGQWILEELREHGYDISPGTLYPLLRRLEKLGWLAGRREGAGMKARKVYRLTRAGAGILEQIRGHVSELKGELRASASRAGRR